MGAGPRITPQPPPRHALIRLTPLIDVIFILLIFFMLASTLESREQISVGVAPPAGAGPTTADTVRVSLEPDAVVVDGRRVTASAMMSAVAAAVRDRNARIIHLQPQAGVSLQTALQALERMRGLDVEVSLLEGGGEG